MYCAIDIRDDDEVLPWQRLVHATADLPDTPLPLAELRACQNIARTIVAVVFEPLGSDRPTTDERRRVEQAVLDLVPWMAMQDMARPERFDFTVRCAIAHHRLPEGPRLAREARIRTILDSTMPQAAWRRLMAPRWIGLQQAAVLVPDAVLERELRSSAARNILRAARQGTLPDHSPVVSMLSVLDAHRQTLGDDFDAVASALGERYLARKPEDRPAFWTLTCRLLEQQDKWRLILDIDRMLQATCPDGVDAASAGECLSRALTRCLPLDDRVLQQEIIDFELRRMEDTRQAMASQMARQFVDAVLAGVPLGGALGERVRALLQAEQEAIEAAEREPLDPVAAIGPQVPRAR